MKFRPAAMSKSFFPSIYTEYGFMEVKWIYTKYNHNMYMCNKDS